MIKSHTILKCSMTLYVLIKYLFYVKLKEKEKESVLFVTFFCI